MLQEEKARAEHRIAKAQSRLVKKSSGRHTGTTVVFVVFACCDMQVVQICSFYKVRDLVEARFL